MHTHYKSIFMRCIAAIALAAAALNVFADTTDISDTPMAVKNNVPPNFMYMIDNSGSMSNIVPDTPYSAATTYLNCPTAKIVSAGFSDPTNPPASPTYDLLIKSDGTPSFTNGSNYYKFGTGSGQVCFDSAKYYNFRLLADTSSSHTSNCGSSNTPCKYPGSGYLDAVYSGNFLNWYFGAAPHYTSASTLDYVSGRKAGTQTRLEIAKSSVAAVLDSIPLKTNSIKAKARVGLSTYNGDDGGKLLENMADLDSTHLTDLKASINALTSTGSTPLSETLADIGQYFTIPYTLNLTLHPNASHPTTASVAQVFKQGGTAPHKLQGTLTSPIQNWCQRSYAILMTDGRPQSDQALSNNIYLCDYDGDSGGCTTSGATAYDKKTGAAASSHTGHIGPGVHSYESAGSDYLNDVAQALYEIDLRPDLTVPGPDVRPKKNNIRTYTVGFADDQAKNDPLLKETAAQGGGIFQTAGNSSELVSAFNKAMTDAFAKDSASAAVAVVNTQLTVDNTAYASSYNSGYWVGDLQAYTLDTTTGIPSATALWSAQAKLDAVVSPATNRNIVTFDGSAGVPFRPANITLSNSNNTNLINYLRGDKSNEDGTNYRKRKNLLGDIINAEPVVVKYSDGTPVVFQAANDGMLHVFNGCGSPADSCNTGAGKELWAYVPKMVWSSMGNTDGGLADPNYVHKYLVDATPAVNDVTISGTTTKLLVGGLGKGGKGYYALDVTSYSANNEAAYANKVKWEFPASASGVSDSVGYSYGTPLIVNSPSGWVVLVPSGYNNTDGSGKVFALNPLTGAVVHTLDTGAGSSGSPAGLAYISKLSASGAGDVIKYVYGGDLLGNVWRFDLTNWTVKKIAVLTDGPGNTQPVSTMPAVGLAYGSLDKYFVYVGTGLYLGDSDIPGNNPVNGFATQTQSMYGIIDDTSIANPVLPNIRGDNGSSCPSNGGNGAFVCQDQGAAADDKSYTGMSNVMTTDQTGWYFDLPITNSRVVTHPQLTTGGALVFTINIPTNQECDPGGFSYFANVDASNGGAIATTYGGLTYYPTITFAGYALASRPVVVTSSNGKHAVIRMADQTFISPLVHEPPHPSGTASGWKRIYWRELM
jgi:type IV pilus assembly protein PilY1